jgi:tetratricopeptide (TPR) repeat protein
LLYTTTVGKVISMKSIWITVLCILIVIPKWAAALPIAATPKDFLKGDVFIATPGQKLLREALQLVRQGKYDLAIVKAEGALIKNSNSAPAYEIIGTALALKGDIDGGLKQLQKAIKTNPGQKSAYTKIGDIHLVRGKSQQAKEYFLKAVTLNKKDRLAHQRLGRIYDDEKDINKAIEHYELGILGTPPRYIGIKVDLGRLYNRIGEYQKTLDLLTGLISQKTNSATAHIVLGTAYLGLKKMDVAIREYKIAAQLEPDSERAPLALGIAYREASEFNASLVALSEVVALKPGWSTGYYQLAETYAALKDYDNAEAYYLKAEKFSKNPLFIQKKRAELYITQKRYPIAIELYRQMIGTGEADLNTFDLLGTAYQISGQFSHAENTFLDMKKAYPGNIFARLSPGSFLQRDKEIRHGSQRT